MARVALPILDARIQARVEASIEAHPAWPCRDGCDHCCRSLPSLPKVSAPEWERMHHAIEALAPDVRMRVHVGIASLRGIERRVTCPLLSDAGSCRIYDARPVACRSYGFYTERDAGLHCERVLDALAPQLDQVLWGNGEALGRELDALGEARPLDAWLDGCLTKGRD